MVHPLLKTETLPIARVSGRRGNGFDYHAPKATKLYRFTGTPGEFLSMLTSLSEKFPRLHDDLKDRSAWAGFTSESPLDAAKKGFSSDALKAFETAHASLGPSMSRGVPQLSPMGPAYSVPRVLQGHPIACFKRPKTKLPPVSLDLTVNAWSGREAAHIQASLSRIARAAWDYQALGGPVTLTVHHLYYFSEPRDGHDAFLASLKIPLSSGAQFATGASLQMFRGLAMPLASYCLSGRRGDSLPLAQWANPRTLPLTGEPSEDAKILAQLHIR